jgi:hypothetical protein
VKLDPGLLWQKRHLTIKESSLTSTLELKLKKKPLKPNICSLALYGAETWTHRAVDQKHLENILMWYRRRV